jgi:hypothetical protein
VNDYIQRLFGIADVTVETAGGGGGSAQDPHAAQSAAAHRGLIEGVADAPRIRDLVLARLRRSQSAGLGDEPAAMAEALPTFGPEHLKVLREIRDAAESLVNR